MSFLFTDIDNTLTIDNGKINEYCQLEFQEDNQLSIYCSVETNGGTGNNKFILTTNQTDELYMFLGANNNRAKRCTPHFG